MESPEDWLYGGAIVKLSAESLKSASDHYQKGIQYYSKGRIEEAVNSFRAAIKANSGHIDAYNSLGSMLMMLGRTDEGVECFRSALAVDPEHANTLLNFGSYQNLAGNYAEAEISFKLAVKAAPQSAVTHQKLGLFYYMHRQFDRAEHFIRRSLGIDVNNAQSQLALAEILEKKGETSEAIQCFRQICKSNPGNLRANLGQLLTLFPINTGNVEIDERRSSFRKGISYLNAKIDSFLGLRPEEMIEAMERTNFLLAYHGRDDRDAQKDYALLQRKFLKSVLPRYYENIEAKPLGDRRLRVGFISEFFYSSTVGKYFRSWITDLNPQKFEKIVFSLIGKPDQLNQEIQQASDAYHQHNFSLTSLAQTVYDANLDVIIYPDLGMNPRTFALASMRLAPLQCAAWGHPVTTGHENIDVFFSVESMEPPSAKAHYTERLVTLPGIGTSYARPAVPDPVSRARLGLPEDAILYLFPQSLFKIHPDNDALLVEILKLEPRAVLVMFRAPEQAINRRFSERLGTEFGRQGISATGRIRALPRMSHQDYLRVNLACDVMLDSLYWSGGNTAIDAIACSLPLVTLPGEFMRGRQSTAMLSAMGLDELVADSKEDLVRIALELGRDLNMRNRIRDAMTGQSGIVFNQQEPIRKLESHLMTLFQEKCRTQAG